MIVNEYVCIYVCIYVCMYVCMYVCVCVYVLCMCVYSLQPVVDSVSDRGASKLAATAQGVDAATFSGFTFVPKAKSGLGAM
jgi:hypothetical protein